LSSFPRAADTIPFGPGEPDASVFPLDPMRDVLRDIFDDVSAARNALQYGASEGEALLRQRLCDHMAIRGVHCSPENILLTNGAQQALNLVSETFVDPDDT
ncbi:aminotransferase class I/II-fold pyridoxal phosphate-dependent enzyme, partial [Rhizobiaceae sp. 2RAB30]